MKLTALLVALVLSSLCACGVPTPEEEQVESSQASLTKGPGPTEDPCITECKKITDMFKRNSCIEQCILSNMR